MNTIPIPSSFVLEAISIDRPFADVFKILADRYRLPDWTKAFSNITPEGADFDTPAGIVPIKLIVQSDALSGVVDTVMTFPDGNTWKAYSRAISETPTRTNVQFFFAPPFPPEALGELLPKLTATIKEELVLLKSLC